MHEQLLAMQERLNRTPHLLRLGRLFSETVLLKVDGQEHYLVFEKGRLVELATTDKIFTRPENPYTRRLIGAVPVVSSEEAALRDHIMEQENGNA